MSCKNLGLVLATGLSVLALRATLAQPAGEPPPGPDPATEAAIKAAVPLTPEEIRAFRDRTDDVSRAVARPPNGELPQLRTGSTRVSLQPGAAIPAVRIVPGLFSSICVLDKSGQPWPIKTYSGAGQENQYFQATHPQPHVLEVSAKVPYTLANLSLTLEQLPTPVAVNLLIGHNRTHDSRVDLHLDACGPNCRQQGDYTPPLDTALYDLLDGIPPDGAVRRPVRGSPDTQVWQYDGVYYLRTREVLLSPSCQSQSARSIDGTRACIIRPIPVIAVSRAGRRVNIYVD